MVRRIISSILLFCIVGCTANTGANTEIGTNCASLSFNKEEVAQVNPVSSLEAGDYFFEDGKLVSNACVLMRTCQVNDYVRTRFGQSYYVSLTTRGGAEIARLFPKVVKDVKEGRGSEKMIYLNNFCALAIK